ncbi:MAG: PhnD/SsuA/transferrin family substrate-binding protein [Pseudomonadota bacterium]
MHSSAISIITSALLMANAALADTTLRIGIVAQNSAIEGMKAGQPVTDALSPAAAMLIGLETERDIQTFEACSTTGTHGTAHLNLYQHVIFSENEGYEPIARHEDQPLSGEILVQLNSAYSDLNHLQGFRFGFPSPALFGAFSEPNAEATALGTEHATQRYLPHALAGSSIETGTNLKGKSSCPSE